MVSVGPSHPVLFTTQTPYPLPSQKFMIPATWKRYQLSQLVNKALSLPTPVPFDFLISGEILRGSLGEWCAEKGTGEEQTLEIEYIESVMPPQKMSNMPHEDWVSAVSSQVPGHFLTTSYDGCIRSFDHSQKLTNSTQAHLAPIAALCMVPSPNSPPNSVLLATASHDLSARLTQFPLSSDSTSKAIASLHTHTAPLSSISSSPSGTHLLTASWDTLVGVWDTAIPTVDEVPLEIETIRTTKRRRLAGGDETEPGVRRKAPITVLKGHTARVSSAIYDVSGTQKAYSSGFDSTVRTWDVESGVCTHTLTAAEKPFVALAQTCDGGSLLAASTDRTVSFLPSNPAETSTSGIIATMMHPSTPSCIAPSPSKGHLFVSGAYDGVVRLWDLRSVKGAIASFKGNGGKKVLSVDWRNGVVAVGGEGGLEIWRVGEGGA